MKDKRLPSVVFVWILCAHPILLLQFPARAHVGKRVRLLDRLLASHPDREAVEELEWLMA